MATSLHSEVENGGTEPVDGAIIEEMKVITQEIETAEIEIAKQQIRAFKPIYEKRKKIFKKIPKFWPQVLTKSLAQYLVNEDLSVIQYIDDITVERDESVLDNFKIILSFSENNDYFKNKELIKEFNDTDGQRKIKSTPIEWTDGRDYTKKRKVDEEEDDQSFIKWFSEENIDETSWELGRALKEDIYPHAWMIYITEEYDDEIVEEEEEEINQDFDDESEEEELEAPKKRAKHN